MNAVHRQSPRSGRPTARLWHDRPLPASLIVFPIGAWSGSLALDVASHTADKPESLVGGALWLVTLGDIAALLAALVGLLGALTTPPRGGADGAECVRIAASVLATAAFIGNLFWRYATYPDLHSPVGPLVLSATSLAFLCAAGWLATGLRRRHTARVVATAKSAARVRRGATRSAVTTTATAGGGHCEHVVHQHPVTERAEHRRPVVAERPREGAARLRDAAERGHERETAGRRRRRLMAGRFELSRRGRGAAGTRRGYLLWPTRRAEPDSPQ